VLKTYHVLVVGENDLSWGDFVYQATGLLQKIEILSVDRRAKKLVGVIGGLRTIYSFYNPTKEALSSLDGLQIHSAIYTEGKYSGGLLNKINTLIIKNTTPIFMEPPKPSKPTLKLVTEEEKKNA
jgi:hypothetical protein